MSKLIEKLRKLSQAAPAPMGFHTSKPTEVGSKMLVIGRLTPSSTASPTKSNAGADAILIHADEAAATAKDVQKTAKSLGDIPWGVYLEESGAETPALIDAGCDFVIFSPTSPVNDLPQDEKIGKILQVESSMDDGLLRAVNDLPADALLITDTMETTETLTMHRLMIYRHLSNLIGKPLIVPVPANITQAELKALQDAEIDGVTAEIDGDNLKELQKNISKLPPRATKKQGKGGVILPRISSDTIIAPPDEEEEE